MIVIFSFSFITLFLTFVHFIIKIIIKKHFAKIDIQTLITNEIENFNMNTFIVLKEKTSSYYDLEQHTIYISDSTGLDKLCESLHEFGHAFIHTFKKHKAYSNLGIKTITYEDEKVLYHDEKETLFIQKTDFSKESFFNPILAFILNYSIAFSFLFCIGGIAFELKSLIFVGFIFSIVSFCFLMDTFLEEIRASQIAYSILLKEAILDKNEYFLSKVYLFSALSLYGVLVLISIALVIFQLLYLLNVIDINTLFCTNCNFLNNILK